MWTYKQSTGELFDAIGRTVGRGYSGAPEAKNDPSRQNEKWTGPIPRGEYLIGPPRTTPTHGPYVLTLTPDAGNEMFGRSGFLIHGDSIRLPGTASEGCVILPRSLREAIWDSGDHVLEVVE